MSRFMMVKLEQLVKLIGLASNVAPTGHIKAGWRLSNNFLLDLAGPQRRVNGSVGPANETSDTTGHASC